MNSLLYKQVQRQYEIKRDKAIETAELRKKELLEKTPKLRELVDKKNKLALDLAKSVIISSGIQKQVAKENLEIKLNEVEKEIENYIKSLKN